MLRFRNKMTLNVVYTNLSVALLHDTVMTLGQVYYRLKTLHLMALPWSPSAVRNARY